MAYPDESCWPYEPNARKSTRHIDWFSIPDESFLRANASRIRSLEEADARKLYTDDRLAHRIAQLPDDAKDALDRMMTGTTEERPKSSAKQELRSQLEDEIENVKADALAQGNIAGQLQAIKLHAEIMAAHEEKHTEKKEDAALAARLAAARKRIS
jgi:hypothetical protein